MTTTVTKESLAARIAELESGARSLKEDYTLAAYKMLLAAMEAEPVAWIHEDELPDGYPYNSMFPFSKVDIVRMFPVFAPQPAPEAMPECFRNAVSALESLYRNGQKQCWHERYTTDMAYASGVLNSCRAAMLAAAPQSPGSDHATVPGKWIPVNERLPEAGGDMIVFTDGIVMSGVSYAKKKGFYIQALEYDDDGPVDSVTHWMPLPAAPQEVKGE